MDEQQERIRFGAGGLKGRLIRLRGRDNCVSRVTLKPKPCDRASALSPNIATARQDLLQVPPTLRTEWCSIPLGIPVFRSFRARTQRLGRPGGVDPCVLAQYVAKSQDSKSHPY